MDSKQCSDFVERVRERAVPRIVHLEGEGVGRADALAALSVQETRWAVKRAITDTLTADPVKQHLCDTPETFAAALNELADIIEAVAGEQPA